MKISRLRILSLLVLLSGCAQDQNKKKLSLNPKFSRLHSLDTTTSSGWEIEYLTSLDSADLKINWKKDDKFASYFVPDVLKLKTDFIPTYIGENDSNIFLTHLCANDCEALLILSKTKQIAKDFFHVIRYDMLSDKVIFIHEMTYKNEDTLKISLTDLKTFKDTTVVFKNMALGSFKTGYIDSVNFGNKSIYISALLLDRSDFKRQKYIRETKIVNF